MDLVFTSFNNLIGITEMPHLRTGCCKEKLKEKTAMKKEEERQKCRHGA